MGLETASSIEVHHLSHAFGGHAVLEDIDLHVRPGELMTLLGPSGSGKSTLLRLIAGLLEVQTGSIDIAGVDVTALPANRRDIGLVFQNYALFPHLDVFSNVAFPLRMRRVAMPERRDRALEALRLVGLEQLSRRMPGELSGGQQQRVAIARAVVAQPRVLLLDEPMGALDRRLREQLSLELRALQQEVGITTVYVTHDQEEAFTLSDRIAVMNAGRIVQLGPPLAVYDQPSDRFTAEFLGDISGFQGRTVTTPEGGVGVLTDSGMLVRCAATDLSPGTPVFAGIRPEDLRPVAGGAGDDGVLSGTVVASVFQGRGHRLQVRLESGEPVVVDVHETGRAEPGERVLLAYDAGDVIVCAAGSAGAPELVEEAST